MNEEKVKAKFTAWLDTVAYRTKLNYIRNERKHTMMTSLDDVPEDRLLINDEDLSIQIVVKSGFHFRTDWLEEAYEQLSDIGKQILLLQLVEKMELKDIATRIGYSYRHTKRLYALSLEAIRIWKETH